MSLYVIAYDIADDRRRRSVARILEDYGRRVQQSVFEVWLEPKQVRALRRRVGPHLGHDDRFDFFPVDERGTRRRISWQRTPNPYEPVNVIAPLVDGRKPHPGCRVFRRSELPELETRRPFYRKIRYLKVAQYADEDVLPQPVSLPEPGMFSAMHADMLVPDTDD